MVFSLFDFAANCVVRNRIDTTGKVPVEVETELALKRRCKYYMSKSISEDISTTNDCRMLVVPVKKLMDYFEDCNSTERVVLTFRCLIIFLKLRPYMKKMSNTKILLRNMHQKAVGLKKNVEEMIEDEESDPFYVPKYIEVYNMLNFYASISEEDMLE